MKTLKEFEEMAVDFRDTLEGNIGTAFFNAAFRFMSDHHFENHTVCILYEGDGGKVLFFTDHPLNDAGFVFMEVYDVKSGACIMSMIRAESKAKTKILIAKAMLMKNTGK